MRCLYMMALVSCVGCSDSTDTTGMGGSGGAGGGETSVCDEAGDGDAVCASLDGALPVCVEGTCRECRDAATCAEAAPVCVSNTCTTCGAPGRSDACMERSAQTPVCGESGQCVECFDHDDCPSGVCERGDQTCVPESRIVYVDSDRDVAGQPTGMGEDTANCGGRTTPCLTLAHAIGSRIDALTGRTWLKLASGVYVDAPELENQALQIIGDDEVTIAANSPQFALVVGEGVDLWMDRVSLSGGGGNLGCGGILDGDPSSVRFTRAGIRDASNADISGRGVSASNCRIEFVEATIERNRGIGIRMREGALRLERSIVGFNRGGGIDLDFTDYTIVNNFIIHNGGDSLVGGFKIRDDGPNERVFEFNTVAGNRNLEAAGSAAGVDCATRAPIEINNSIIWGNAFDALAPVAEAQIGGFCTVSYCDVQGGVTPAPTLPGLSVGEGMIDADPLFVDPFRFDYRISPESPARNTADPEATLDEDIDGRTRPVDGRRDMGAHEVRD